jgi:hypothetical protein
VARGGTELPGWLLDYLIRWLCQDTRPWRRSESERSIAGPVAQTKPRSTQRVRNGVAAQDSAGARRFLLASRPFHETCSPFGASENWASAPHSAFSILPWIRPASASRRSQFIECVLVCHCPLTPSLAACARRWHCCDLPCNSRPRPTSDQARRQTPLLN